MLHTLQWGFNALLSVLVKSTGSKQTTCIGAMDAGFIAVLHKCLCDVYVMFM